MKLPYQLICLDLDGTLLVSRHHMDQETIEVLREIENLGASIAIATGRPAFIAKSFAKSISENAYFIGSNGAVVGKVDQKEYFSIAPMKRETLEQLFDISSRFGVLPLLYTVEETLILNTEFARRAIRNNSWLNRVSDLQLHLINSKKQFESYVMDDDVKVTKANLFFPNEEQTRKAIRMLNESNSFTLEVYSNIGLEVVEKGMNKSCGIDVLRKVLKVDREKIIAFGDSENDREMMLYVGHAVAMGNAIQPIKDIADAVADTNQNKGVAKALIKIYGITNTYRF